MKWMWKCSGQKNWFITINNAIFNIGEAWNDLQVQILQRCWNKLWPILDSAKTEGETDSAPTEGEILQLCSSIPGCKNISRAEVICLDIYKMNEGHESLDEEAVVQMSESWLIVRVLKKKKKNKKKKKKKKRRRRKEEEEAAAYQRSNIISFSEAETVLTNCSEWFEVQNVAHATQVLRPHKISLLEVPKGSWRLKRK